MSIRALLIVTFMLMVPAFASDSLKQFDLVCPSAPSAGVASDYQVKVIDSVTGKSLNGVVVSVSVGTWNLFKVTENGVAEFQLDSPADGFIKVTASKDGYVGKVVYQKLLPAPQSAKVVAPVDEPAPAAGSNASVMTGFITIATDASPRSTVETPAVAKRSDSPFALIIVAAVLICMLIVAFALFDRPADSSSPSAMDKIDEKVVRVREEFSKIGAEGLDKLRGEIKP